MILSPTEKLRKFLKLELNRKCDNRAVVGGLGRYLPVWQKETLSGSIDRELSETVAAFLKSYEEKDSDQRRSAVEEILKQLPPEESQAKNGSRQNRHFENNKPRGARWDRSEEQPPVENGKPVFRPRTDSGESPVRSSRFEKQPRRPIPETELKPAKKEPQKTEAIPRNFSPVAEVPAPEVAADVVLPAAAVDDSVKRISHPIRSEQPHLVDVAALRAAFGRPEVLPNGPSVDSPVSEIPGIGTSNSKALNKQNVYTVRDFLYYFPRRYDDYSCMKMINRLVPDEVVSVLGVVEAIENTTRGKLQLTTCLLQDGTGRIRVTWFNRAWLIHQIHIGQAIVVSGKVDVYLGRPCMNSPEWEPTDMDNMTTNRIVPIYALNQNLKQNFLRRMIFNTVRHWKGRLEEFLPDFVLESANLMPLQMAISQIHFPDSMEMLNEARNRLAFDEIFLLQLNVLGQKQEWSELNAEAYPVTDEKLMSTWIDHLPFKLTKAQMGAIADIRKDMSSGRPMNRLVQGDVGSGKTAVASIAALIATQDDGQAAIMAPTSVLAEQHYRSFLKFMESIGPENLSIRPEEVDVITGATPEGKKREIRERLESGEIKVLIGTHALIEAPVQFKKLALAVIDEQHRFGVDQRAALRAKGTNPHLLVMTATPIPRSLSLTIYGDLDLSVIGELPAGRQPVETFVLPPVAREQAYRQVDKQIKLGHQVFIIYPLVEEDDTEERESRAAVEGYERLRTSIFPEARVALLHGRMKGEEKEAILTAFKNHEYDILVSTSVIEVGVDVPNATFMIIEGANRFGLAQLHQFRGRVGRGSDKSFCVLIPEKDEAVENDRLKAMVETNDGFKLAEMDLSMRGPGDFIGKRQSGLREMKLANMTDVRLIEKARKQAEALFERDPHLEAEENVGLRGRVKALYDAQQRGEIS